MSCGAACTDDINFCVIRGATFELDVALTEAWQEVFDDPDAFEARLVLKDDMDEGPIRLTMTSPAELTTITPSSTPAQPAIYFRFDATPVETQALPDWNLVGYAELRARTGGDVRRLFNSRVSVEN